MERKRAGFEFWMSLMVIDRAAAAEAVPKSVIPAKLRETGRDPGSRGPRYEGIFLDSGSHSASRRSSGMTFFLKYDSVSCSGMREKQ